MHCAAAAPRPYTHAACLRWPVCERRKPRGHTRDHRKNGDPGLVHAGSYLFAESHLTKAPAEHYELPPDTTLYDNQGQRCAREPRLATSRIRARG